VGDARVHAPAPLQLPLLTLGVLGAQTVWSMDMAFAPPYLLDLGLSKSAMAAVFVAGPLSGLIVQPLIGSLADNSTSRFGRRRPFLAASTLICAASILLLGFAREVAGWFTTHESDAHRSLAILMGVLAVYLVDFSVNAVTALDRALMVDVAATEDQAEANAWAARLCGVGSVLSFLIGNLDLPSVSPTVLGKTQIQIVSVLVSAILVATHALVVLRVEEQVLVPSRTRGSSASKHKPSGAAAVFADLYTQARSLPQPIVEIFKIQFFAQIGWFPILFYSTVWVGEIYKADVRMNGGKQTDHELFEEATRAGSRAFFWHAVLSLMTSIVLPLVVPNPVHESQTHSVWFANSALVRRLRGMRDRWPELPFWWVFANFVFFISMMGTYFAGLTQSVFLATWVIASVGFCFACSNWIPYSLLGILIQTQHAKEVPAGAGIGGLALSRPTSSVRASRDEADEVTMALLGDSSRDDDQRRTSISRTPSYDASGQSRSRPVSHASQKHPQHAHGDADSDDEERLEATLSFGGQSERTNGDNSPHDHVRDADLEQGSTSASSTSTHAGTVLGLHNVAVVIPQFLVTALSSLIFAIMEPKSGSGDSPTSADGSPADAPVGQRSDALGIVFRLGGCCALVAGILAVRLVRRYGNELRG
jgi:solute carrier family 45 protein 1/2/4